jgi:hypothetical protein
MGFLMGAVLLLLANPAHAGSGRKVPDLRRDTAEWVRPRAAAAIRIPVTFHMATDDTDSIVSRRDVRTWVTRANRALEGFGIEVDVVAVRRMPQGWGSVTHWRSRRALAKLAPSDGTVHVFAIEELDEGRRTRRVRGLHWRYRGLASSLRGREYLVVTREAPSTTFAHELGHLFGLRHSSRADNIMCSCRRGQDVSFTALQGMVMRDGARRALARNGSGARGTAAVLQADRRRRP